MDNEIIQNSINNENSNYKVEVIESLHQNHSNLKNNKNFRQNKKWNKRLVKREPYATEPIKKGYNNSFDDNLLSLIKKNFKTLDKNKTEKSLKKCIFEKLSCLEVLNSLYFEDQISKHLKFFKISSKINNILNRDYSNNNIATLPVKEQHFNIILLYKVNFSIVNDENEMNYRDNDDRRRELKLDNNSTSILKLDYYNYIPKKCEYLLNCNYNDLCYLSHNDNEVDYHILCYKTKFCKIKGCRNSFCKDAHSIEDFRRLFQLENNENLIELKEKLEEMQIFESIDKMDELYQVLPSEFNLETYKTIQCPYESNCPVKHPVLCLNFHNWIDRRRNPKKFFYGNKSCLFVYTQNCKYLETNYCTRVFDIY